MTTKLDAARLAAPSAVAHPDVVSNVAGRSVLVVDDEKNIRAALLVCLESMGLRGTAVASAPGAREAVEKARFDLALLDLKLGQDNGLDLLPQLLASQPGLAVVVITAHATFETAVEAIKRGASDYLPKPFTPAQIRHVVERVLTQQTMARRVAELESLIATEVPEADLQSDSQAMNVALGLVARAAPADAPVLLRGENGTGKGVMARSLHAQSLRRKGPFVTVSCPTLADDLLASELFGHTRGAFTGAVTDQVGRVEAANGGTVFLDEIGEISPGLQAKLLRFAQDKEFERVGENRTRHADVRIVAATNRDLEADVKAGRFREDLLFRLNVIEVRVPALRERQQDILRLARGFLKFFSGRMGRATQEIDEPAAAALVTYAWPGNVRELRNVMERAVILWPARILGVEALPPHIAGVTPSSGATVGHTPRVGGDITLEALEREHVIKVLARVPTLDDAARILGIDSSTLWRKRKKYEDQ